MQSVMISLFDTCLRAFQQVCEGSRGEPGKVFAKHQLGVQGYVSVRQQCAREGKSPAGGTVTKCSGDDSSTYTHSLTSCQCLLSHLRVKIPYKAVFFSFLQDNHVVVPQDKTVGPLAGPLLPKRYLLEGRYYFEGITRTEVSQRQQLPVLQNWI